jgi:hypothetical protein
MKYLEILKQRDLSIQNLPKVLQKKIQELDYQYNELKNLESFGELDEDELEDIEIVKEKIDELDSHISHKVKIFDQTKYNEKLAKISKMTELKKAAKNEVEEVKVEQETVTKVVAAPVVQPVVAEQGNQIGNTAQIQEAYVPTPVPEAVPREYVQPSELVQESVQPLNEQYEEDEFERKGTGNPKKMTTGLILMGVGAFFLTWGAVNFFKSRR